MEKRFIETASNPVVLETASIPVLDYAVFTEVVDGMMNSEDVHCLTYFVVPEKGWFRFICCMADDASGTVRTFSHLLEKRAANELPAITAKHFAFHIFEREIHENFGIRFSGHPWLKPVRFPFDRSDLNDTMNSYPFFTIEGEDLHEVGVGPVHAGVIEPGYFRFICKGEQVFHLEIHLGYQHRGIEPLFIEKKKLLQRVILSESITGDTVAGHALCHSMLSEALGGIEVSTSLAIERTIALELERAAIHIGDTAALCTDIAFQFGQAVNEALRTILINTTQLWCGNRFSKGLIRPGGTHYPLTEDLRKTILDNIRDVGERYLQITSTMFGMPSLLSRFETIGTVTKDQAGMIGAVGMAAKSSGLQRDIRFSHPFMAFRDNKQKTVVLDSGDVWARAMLRKLEVEQSFALICQLLEAYPEGSVSTKPLQTIAMAPSSFSLAMTEGWRGEIVHAALTDEKGSLTHYKVNDPSLHNWLALALAVRNQEISDFPLCNKSYNLSYCGYDL